VEEEDEFQNNLQAELRHCIYEDQFQDLQKIIILFKACLLILKTRTKNKILSLDEVQKIVVKTCREETEYTDTVKQIVYLGIKIIIDSLRNIDSDNILRLNEGRQNQAIINQRDEENAKRQQAKYIIDDDFLKIALTKTGVDICQKIFQLILSNSMRTKKKLGASPFKKVDEELSPSNKENESIMTFN